MDVDNFKILSSFVEKNDTKGFCKFFDSRFQASALSYSNQMGLAYQCLELDRIEMFNHLYSRFRTASETVLNDLFKGLAADGDDSPDNFKSIDTLINAHGQPSESLMKRMMTRVRGSRDYRLLSFLINKFDSPLLSAEQFCSLTSNFVNAKPHPPKDISLVVRSYTGSPLTRRSMDLFLVEMPQLELSYLDLCKLFTVKDTQSAFAGQDSTAKNQNTRQARKATL